MCMDIGKAEGRKYIGPYDDPLVIAGQGTVRIVIFESQQFQ